MLSWKNTKCREQQTQSITITTPAAGEESMNCFGLLPACSPTWENTHSPEAHDFIPSHSTLTKKLYGVQAPHAPVLARNLAKRREESCTEELDS